MPQAFAAARNACLAASGVPLPSLAAMQALTAACHWASRLSHVSSSSAAASTLFTSRVTPTRFVLTGTGGENHNIGVGYVTALKFVKDALTKQEIVPFLFSWRTNR